MTASNAVSLLSDNLSNAQTVLIPVGIGIAVLLVAWAIGKRVFKKTAAG